MTDALKIAQTMDSDKVNTLGAIAGAIAEAYRDLNQPQKAAELLADALKIAQTMDDSSEKTSTLIAIAEAQAKLEHWRQARQTADKIPIEGQKLGALARILTIWAEKYNPALVEEENKVIINTDRRR